MIAFQISDMTNSHSAGAITKALQDVDNGVKVRVDWPTFTIEIVPGSCTAEQLGQAITGAGFSPVAV